MRIICNKGKFEHTKQLFRWNKVLNVYKLNTLNVAIFMYQVHKKAKQNIFLSNTSKTISFRNVSERNYVQSIYNFKTSKYSISIKGP